MAQRDNGFSKLCDTGRSAVPNGCTMLMRRSIPQKSLLNTLQCNLQRGKNMAGKCFKSRQKVNYFALYIFSVNFMEQR